MYYVDTCVNLHQKTRLYVAYMKIVKCPNNTKIVVQVLFIDRGNCSFTFLCRSHMIFLPKSAQISINIIFTYVHFKLF
jgi:hypothetical protein